MAIIDPFKAPDPQWHRYTQNPLPPYRFIPGINPHPVRDEAGHGFGKPEPHAVHLDLSAWRTNEFYLYGVDLYNFGYWWESHEAWETYWHTTDKHSLEGHFFQGLIQISAALIKWHLQQPEGLERLFTIGRGRLQKVCDVHPLYMGIDLSKHLHQLDVHFQQVLPRDPSRAWANPLLNYPFIHLNF